MKRILFGVVLDVIATLVMLFFVVLPAIMPIDDVPGLTPFFQNTLCERGETILVERRSYSRRPGSTSYSADFYCVRESGVRRDVSGKVILMGIVGFTLPLVVSLFFIISGAASVKKKRLQTNAAAVLEKFGISSFDNPNAFRVKMKNSRVDEHGTVTDSADMSAAHWGTMSSDEVKSMLKGFGMSVEDDPNTFQTIMSDMGGRGSLVDRLKTLKDAYDQGLITEAEYESKRKEILRDV